MMLTTQVASGRLGALIRRGVPEDDPEMRTARRDLAVCRVRDLLSFYSDVAPDVLGELVRAALLDSAEPAPEPEVTR
ncbi:hypothetical protein VZC37_22910 [Gordonia sp. LSe1-13]|uniref:Anti-sigma factor NepR domain-containing protein n=1 Tax=Gordonia sesuvii TaxID=3116777 RepID=A0ABU7MKX2_9ACTN|nr:hypothetical protein [Gordonia sp. LSe1-13]